MAIKFTNQRCMDCQGKLEFNKSTKNWECPYCGRIYERELRFNRVQIDGLSGINDLVRSSLIEIAKSNDDAAEDSIADAERVNHTHIGTLLANLAYNLFKGIKAKAEDKSIYVGKLNYYKKKLESEFQTIDEEEKILYDFLDAQDAYTVLYVSLQSIGDQLRADYVENFIDYDHILSPTLNSYVMKILLKNQSFEKIDEMLTNVDFLDKRETILEILRKYPDGNKKREHLKSLMSKKAFTYKDEPLIEQVMKESKDSAQTQLTMMSLCHEQNIQFDATNMFDTIFSNDMSDSDAMVAFKAMGENKLSKELSLKLLTYCLSKNAKSLKVVLAGLGVLAKTQSLYEIDGKDIVSFLAGTLLKEEEQIEVIKFIFEQFSVSSKSKDRLMDYMLLEDERLTKDIRKRILEFLFKHITSVKMSTLNDYVLKQSKDDDVKPSVVQMIVDLGMNKAYFTNLLTDYLYVKTDNDRVKATLIQKFLDMKLTADPKAVSQFLLSAEYRLPKEMIDGFFAANIRFDERSLDTYLNNVKHSQSFDEYLFERLLNLKGILSVKNTTKFILKLSDNLDKKPLYTKELIKMTPSFHDEKMSFNYLGQTMIGNVGQVYLLTHTDNAQIKMNTLNVMSDLKVKLFDSLNVDGSNIKFKKLITQNKDQVNDEIYQMCDRLGMNKFLF